MKNITQTCLIICLFIFTISCEDEHIIDSRPLTDEAHLLIPEIVKITMNNMYSTFVGIEMGTSWSQQTSKVQYNDEERYIPRQGVISHLWYVTYNTILPLTDEMYRKGELENNNSIKGAALTLKVYLFSLMTDLYGAVPFSEALLSTTPRYDLQEDIYPQLILLLDQAETLFSSRDLINSDSDVLYQGDITKWKRFANSLKFRCLMRISDVTDVSLQLQQLIETKPMFESNNDEAKYIFLRTHPDANPIFETIVFGNRKEYKICDVTIDKLKENNDPRLAIYAQKNEEGLYIGIPSGSINIPNSQFNYLNVSAIGRLYLKPDAPGYFMSYPELEFLISEAIQKSFISGSVLDHYNSGVNASFEANEIPELARQFLIDNPFDPSIALEQIGTQKWLALYCQGLESWTEQRRTGYPLLTPAVNGDIDEIPSRLNYPEQQQTENAVNYNEAVSLQGPDNLTTQLWWQQ